MKRSLWIVGPLMCFTTAMASAQETTLTTQNEPSWANNWTYTSAMGLYRSHSNGRLGDPAVALAEPGLFMQEPLTWVSYNSSQNVQRNDGSIWQGAGFNWYSRAGLGYQNDWFRVLVAPDTSFAQNLAYSTLGDQTQDYWSGLDRPQRFGNDPVYKIGFGESDIRVVIGGFTAGFSNETVVVGPGEQDNLILSRNAGGFPHFDIGTLNGIKTDWGTFEVRFLWGLPTRTQYYTTQPSDPYNLMEGGSLGWEPPFIPGLQIGLNKYYVVPTSGLNVERSLLYFTDTLYRSGSLTFKEMMTGTIDYAVPGTGFRTYGEISRNDSELTLLAFLEAPFRAMNYLWGAELTIPMNGDWALSLNTELSDMGINVYDVYRSTGGLYRVGSSFGWTNDGKVMGAGIGPGSNSQYLSGTMKSRVWDAGLSINRVGLDNDYLFRVVAPNVPTVYTEVFQFVYNFYFDYGMHAAYRASWGELTAEAHLIEWYNRDWDTHDWDRSVELAIGYKWSYK